MRRGSELISCLRQVRALAVEMHENWLEAMRYLNITSPFAELDAHN
jgi:hypothetical protein